MGMGLFEIVKAFIQWVNAHKSVITITWGVFISCGTYAVQELVWKDELQAYKEEQQAINDNHSAAFVESFRKINLNKAKLEIDQVRDDIEDYKDFPDYEQHEWVVDKIQRLERRERSLEKTIEVLEQESTVE